MKINMIRQISQKGLSYLVKDIDLTNLKKDKIVNFLGIDYKIKYIMDHHALAYKLLKNKVSTKQYIHITSNTVTLKLKKTRRIK